jgi:hypothetical protein
LLDEKFSNLFFHNKASQVVSSCPNTAAMIRRLKRRDEPEYFMATQAAARHIYNMPLTGEFPAGPVLFIKIYVRYCTSVECSGVIVHLGKSRLARGGWE